VERDRYLAGVGLGCSLALAVLCTLAGLAKARPTRPGGRLKPGRLAGCLDRRCAQRFTFVGMQIALVVWAWLGSGRHPDPWLKRTYISTGIFLAWFLLWYLGRYTNLAWPVGDLFKIIALGGISVVLYVFWDWVRGSHTGYDRG
jgi:hypothetical protein